MRRTCLFSFLAVFLAWVGLHAWETHRTNPVLEAQARAVEFGWDADNSFLSEGRYGTRILSRYAHAVLTDRSDRERSIEIRLTKWIPFTDWSLESASIRNGSSETPARSEEHVREQ